MSDKTDISSPGAKTGTPESKQIKELLAAQVKDRQLIKKIEKDHERKIADLQRDLDRRQADAAEAKGEAETTEAGLREELETAETTEAVLREELEKAQNAEAGLREELEKVRRLLEEQNIELGILRHRKNAGVAESMEIDRLELQVETQEEQLSHQNAEITQLTDASSALDFSLGEAESRIQTLEADFTKTAADRKSWYTAYKDLVQSLGVPGDVIKRHRNRGMIVPLYGEVQEDDPGVLDPECQEVKDRGNAE